MSTRKLSKCPYPVGAYSGITFDGKTIIAGPLRCNSWNCPYCHDILKKKLYRRIHQGVMGQEVTSEYSRKFLTLTYGGSVKREDSEPVQAYEEMVLAFHKLIKVLRSIYGYFDYFRVNELHKDGWPHFHVMLVGDRIAPRDILDRIRHFWCEVYGMGFVRINCIKFRDAKHATNYMLKYITKDIQKIAPKKRIFTASRNALLKVQKVTWRGVPLVHLGNDIQNMESRVVTVYKDEDLLHLPGWKTPCINIGPSIVELPDYQEMLRQACFDRMVATV